GRDFLNEVRRLFGYNAGEIKFTRHRSWNDYWVKMRKGRIDSGEVLYDHGLAAFSVSFPDRVFDLLNGFIARKYATDCEEASLHDGVNSVAELIGFRDCIRINCEDLNLLFDDCLLQRSR